MLSKKLQNGMGALAIALVSGCGGSTAAVKPQAPQAPTGATPTTLGPIGPGDVVVTAPPGALDDGSTISVAHADTTPAATSTATPTPQVTVDIASSTPAFHEPVEVQIPVPPALQPDPTVQVTDPAGNVTSVPVIGGHIEVPIEEPGQIVVEHDPCVDQDNSGPGNHNIDSSGSNTSGSNMSGRPARCDDHRSPGGPPSDAQHAADPANPNAGGSNPDPNANPSSGSPQQQPQQPSTSGGPNSNPSGGSAAQPQQQPQQPSTSGGGQPNTSGGGSSTSTTTTTTP
jgi:hypothetical protein